MKSLVSRSISFLDTWSYGKSRLEFLGHLHKAEYAQDLRDIIHTFRKHEIRIHQITQSALKSKKYSFDFEVEDGVELGSSLKRAQVELQYKPVQVSYEDVPWFPRDKSDLRLLEVSPPSPVPVDSEEWSVLLEALSPLHEANSCSEYLRLKQVLQLSTENPNPKVPRLTDVNQSIRQMTGFSLRPLNSLPSPRVFLNHLAFRVYPFVITDRYRHLVGIIPMLGNSDFADMIEQIGLASLGATDGQVSRLELCYFYAAEYGLIKEVNGTFKAFGGSINSSAYHLRTALGQEAREYLPMEFCKPNYPFTQFHWLNSLAQGTDAIAKFEKYMKKSVTVKKEDSEIKVFRKIQISI